MNRPTIRNSIFIAAILTASAAFAGGDIVKCVDQNGHVTLTENQCSEGVQTVLVAGGSETPAALSSEAAPAPAAAPARRVQRIVYIPEAIQHDSLAASLPRAKMLSRDAATLKAARTSMQVMDEASSALRHQRLAGVN